MDAHFSVDPSDAVMSLDLGHGIKLELRNLRGDRAQTFLKFGTRECLADTAVCAKTKDRMQSRLIRTMYVEPVRIAVDCFVGIADITKALRAGQPG
jgi:hypothetical protein